MAIPPKLDDTTRGPETLGYLDPVEEGSDTARVVTSLVVHTIVNIAIETPYTNV